MYPVTNPGITGGTATVMVMALDGAVVVLIHCAFEVMIKLTTSVLPSVVLEKVELAELLPVFTLFSRHWYNGVAPPSKGVALKVTNEPGHIDPDIDDAIVTVGLTFVTMFIVIEFELAGLLGVHTKLELATQLTTALLGNVLVVKVALLPPALTPFTFHW